jgi:hypothetical protein
MFETKTGDHLAPPNKECTCQCSLIDDINTSKSVLILKGLSADFRPIIPIVCRLATNTVDLKPARIQSMITKSHRRQEWHRKLNNTESRRFAQVGMILDVSRGEMVD